MKKYIQAVFLCLSFIFCVTVFSAEIAYAENAKVSPLRISLLGGMFAGEGQSVFYGALPWDISKVIGFDLGVIGTKVNTVYGLQAALVSISSNSAGIQISPAFSQTDNIKGLQLSGLISFSRYGMTGVQIGGLAAVTMEDSFNGIQCSGIGSVNNVQFNGIQMSCLVSYSENINGVQFGGLVSKINHSYNGIQSGLLWTYSENGNGLQIGGLGGGAVCGMSLIGLRLNSQQKSESYGVVISALSIGKNFFGDFYNVNGVQISGINLFTGKTKGVQIGMINITEEVKGLQIGMINYASVLNGVQIGLVNIARNAKIQVLPVVNFKF